MAVNEVSTSPIDLDKIIQKNDVAISQFRSLLSKQGWAFVNLPTDYNDLIDKSVAPLEHIFKQIKDKSLEYWKYSKGLYGLYSFNHKVGLRFLTGGELPTEGLIPESVQENMIKLSKMLDDSLIKITEAVSEQFFNCSTSELGVKGDLPLLYTSGSRFGMLDVTYYLNDVVDPVEREKKRYPEENCAEHYDPGLFSLSILQTAPGLQLKGEDGSWYEGPLRGTGLGVIWAGHAAQELSNGQIKSGVHRVVYPKEPGTPRMSLWAELCTRSQAIIESEGLFGKKTKTTWSASKLLVPNLGGTKQYIIPVEEGKLLEALALVERVKGLPFSKVMRVPIFNADGEVIGIK